MPSYFLFLIFFAFCFGFNLEAQGLFSNQGANISIGPNTLVSVQGTVINAQNGSFDNQGEIQLDGDWLNQSNNFAFTRPAGRVVLRAGNQAIGGGFTTRFYELILRGSGIKTAQIETWVLNELQLNNLELHTQNHTLRVFNTSPLAVQTSSLPPFGFVSADAQGGLAWALMQQNQAYVFPLGSSQNNPRFRPLSLQALDPLSDTAWLKCQHSNLDPSLDNWDRNRRQIEICQLNPNYYHRIEALQNPSNANFQIQYFYNPNTDGSDYNALAQWQDPQNLWAEASPATTHSPNNPWNLAYVQTNQGINQFNPPIFALARTAPSLTVNLLPNPLCSSDTLQIQAQSNISQFDFFIDSLLVQTGPQNQYRSPNNLTTGFYPVWVQTFDGQCGRQSPSLLLEVRPSPQIQTTADTFIVRGSPVQLWASGGDFYLWSPDQNLDCAICPQTQAYPNADLIYQVQVENLEGCRLSRNISVQVRDQVQNLVFIPNVLTPNGDGFNDTWRIDNIQLFPQNKVRIFNRLGDLVFQSEYYNNTWDGTFAGGRLPAGTYYYVLDLGEGWGIFKGPVTIIRE